MNNEYGAVTENRGIGLVSVMTPDEVTAREAEQKLDPMASQRSALGHQLFSAFETRKTQRKTIEDIWLRALRAFNGQYDSATEQLMSSDEYGHRSKVFVKLTRTKVMSAYARITDLLSRGKFWSLSSTPVPDLPEEVRLEIKRMAITELMQYGLPPQMVYPLIQERMQELENDHHTLFKDHAEKAAKAMEREIDDIMAETKAVDKIHQAIMESCILGSGAIKSGTVKIHKKPKWKQKSNVWAIDFQELAKAEIDWVSVFDLYPDPYATTPDQLNDLYRRHVLVKEEFRNLKNDSSFDKAAIDRCLLNNQNGNHVLLDHERDRLAIANIQQWQNTGRFEVLEYWGHVDGLHLQQAGIPVADRLTSYSANVWLCGNEVIKLRLNPITTERVPYYIFPYEMVPHSFWGTSPAIMMEDSQEMINAGVRALLDNLAISSGPQVEVDVSKLPDGMSVNDAQSLYPWKVWLRSGGDGAHPMVRFNQPTNVSAGIMQVVDMFRRFADEETAMPSYTHGTTMPGMNKTASGMSMLMGAANMQIKTPVKNLDTYLVKPLIESLYDWYMQYGTNEQAKSGDIDVVTHGSTTLVAKEVQAQQIMQFLQMTSNPVDGQLTDRRYLLQEAAESLDISSEKAVPEIEKLRANAPVTPPTQPGASPVDPNSGMVGAQQAPMAAA